MKFWLLEPLAAKSTLIATPTAFTLLFGFLNYLRRRIELLGFEKAINFSPSLVLRTTHADLTGLTYLDGDIRQGVDQNVVDHDNRAATHAVRPLHPADRDIEQVPGQSCDPGKLQ